MSVSEKDRSVKPEMLEILNRLIENYKSVTLVCGKNNYPELRIIEDMFDYEDVEEFTVVCGGNFSLSFGVIENKVVATII